jgi:hypothetical protein
VYSIIITPGYKLWKQKFKFANLTLNHIRAKKKTRAKTKKDHILKYSTLGLMKTSQI